MSPPGTTGAARVPTRCGTSGSGGSSRGLYGADKAAAQQGRRRTPESTLHLIGLAGGWPGALIARQLFRHKTVKQPFSTIFWGTVAVNCGALACLWMVPTLSSLLAA